MNIYHFEVRSQLLPEGKLAVDLGADGEFSAVRKLDRYLRDVYMVSCSPQHCKVQYKAIDPETASDAEIQSAIGMAAVLGERSTAAVLSRFTVKSKRIAADAAMRKAFTVH